MNSTNVIWLAVISLIVILYARFSALSRSTTITLSFFDSSGVKSLPFVLAVYWLRTSPVAAWKLIVIVSGSG